MAVRTGEPLPTRRRSSATSRRGRRRTSAFHRAQVGHLRGRGRHAQGPQRRRHHALIQLEAKHGKLPETLKGKSPTGSVHHYFNCPTDVVIKNTESKIALGVDVRGDGGMVIAPPSIRPGKGRYRWINNHPVADAPTWLIELCRDKDDGRKHEPNKKLMAEDLDELAVAVEEFRITRVAVERMTTIAWAIGWIFAEPPAAANRASSYSTSWARKSKKYGTSERGQQHHRTLAALPLIATEKDRRWLNLLPGQTSRPELAQPIRDKKMAEIHKLHDET